MFDRAKNFFYFETYCVCTHTLYILIFLITIKIYETQKIV